MTTPKSLVPESVEVKKIPTNELIPNPHNPRMLFDREPHVALKKSIGKVGILVPLTVYWGTPERSYVILDGQRRWICATEVGLPEVPVNVVAEPSLVQNIVTMFQIHAVREDWELMPTALKIEVLMNALKEKNDKVLAELTGVDPATVTRCKKLLSYPKKYQEMMLNADPKKRPSADFFIELFPVRNSPFLTAQGWFKKDHFTQRMLEKYQAKQGLRAVTDFRKMTQYIRNAERAKKGGVISKRLKDFIEDDSLTLDYLLVREADISATARKLVSRLEKLETEMTSLDVEEFYAETKLWDVLEKLLRVIYVKLQAASRRIKL